MYIVREDLRKVKVIAIAICLAGFFANNVLAQVGIEKTAKQTLEIGESYKLKISPPTKIVTKPEQGGYTPPSGFIEEITPVYSDFKIITSEDGNLTLSFETFAEETKVTLYDANGIALAPTSKELVTGNESVSWGGDKTLYLRWNTVVEKFIGSFTWKLDAGIYYLRITREQKGLSATNLSLSFKDLEGNEVK